MAKKTAKPAAPKKKAPAPKKPAPKTAAPKKAAPKKAAPPKPAINNDQIGCAAGEVWALLHGQGWQTLAAVKKGVDQPADVTLMAIGWLAREGKLDFTTSGRTLKMTLR